MKTMYILLLICIATFMFASYHAILNGYTWAIWVTGISMFATFALALWIAMFRNGLPIDETWVDIRVKGDCAYSMSLKTLIAKIKG